MKRLFLNGSLVLLIFYNCSNYRQSNVSEAKEIIITAVDSFAIPSLSAAVYKKDKLVFNFAYGIESMNSKAPVSNDDPYHIGSIGKSMTATLIGYLVEENKISWDTKIIDVFPDLDTLGVDYVNASLQQLLTNSSGLADPFTAEDWRTMEYSTDRIHSQQLDLMINVLKQEKNKKRGIEWEYANANFTIAALMVEEVTKNNWETLIGIYLEPNVGIDLGFGWPRDNDQMTVPKGHVKIDGIYEVWGPDHPHKVPVSIRPAGDIFMTTKDLAKYGYYHIKGLKKGYQALSKKNFQIMHTPLLENYAMGWNIVPDGISGLEGFEMHQHLGSGGTFKAVLSIFPELDISVAVVHNGGGETASLSYAYRNLAKRFSDDKK